MMRNTPYMRVVRCVIVFACMACSRDSRSGDGTREVSAVAGMQDSAGSSSSIALTAAQIVHGAVEWAVPPQTRIAGSVEVPGQLVANEDRMARLSAPALGRVLAVHVSPGERVSVGSALVTLESQEASMAQADLAKAQAELASRRAAAAYAKSARDRAERLLVLKAIPRQDYERAVADDELARAGLSQAVAELQRTRSNASQLGMDARAGTMTVRSPIAGVVTTRDVIPGAVVSAGTQLVTITDPTTLWLTAALPEASSSQVLIGSQLRFMVPPYPSDTFVARVQSVSGAFDPTTRSLPVRGVVANALGRLRPEMFARIWVENGVVQTVITVPEGAVQRIDDEDVVFIVHPDPRGGARFVKREVTAGGTSGGRTSILRGIAPGEVVVIKGAYAVKAEFAKGKMPKMEM
jgi:cobalt-zinc-cadmium efflux system membrane fusion protein